MDRSIDIHRVFYKIRSFWKELQAAWGGLDVEKLRAFLLTDDRDVERFFAYWVRTRAVFRDFLAGKKDYWALWRVYEKWRQHALKIGYKVKNMKGVPKTTQAPRNWEEI